jgi:hypothetical protein
MAILFVSSWLWQGILTSAIVAIGGVVVGFISKRWPTWFPTIRAGLLGGFLLAGIVAAIRLSLPASPHIDPDNIEDQVKQWLTREGHGFKEASTQETLFQLDVPMSLGQSDVSVIRFKTQDHYLWLKACVGLNAEEQATLSKLPTDQQVRAIWSVTTELIRFRVSFEISPGRSVTVHKHVPIDDSLTEDSFMSVFDDVYGASLLAAHSMISDYGKALKYPSFSPTTH